MKILLIDDSKDFCTLVTQYVSLEDDLEIVDIANDGKAAMNLLANNKYDIAVCDVILPYFDGISIAKFINTLEDRPKLILMSTAINDNIIKETTPYGVDFFMKKPFVLDDMLSRIRMVLPQNGVSLIEHEEISIKITKVLQEIGIPAHIKGYKYLRYAIEKAIENADVLDGITKYLYPMLAKEFGTSPQSIERTIRHAIEVAWDRGNVEILNGYFGWTINKTKGKPTNSEFIAMIVDKLSLERMAKVSL